MMKFVGNSNGLTSRSVCSNGQMGSSEGQISSNRQISSSDDSSIVDLVILAVQRLFVELVDGRQCGRDVLVV